MIRKILVTGGFGFIGGHLIERLLQDEDNHITVVDNLTSNPIHFHQLLDELGNPQNLDYAIGDVTVFCKRHSGAIDTIYHLASPVGPAGILAHAGKIARMVIRDAYDLAELAIEWDATLIDISTSEIYGGGENGLCTEDHPRTVPATTTVRLEYAIAKLAAETALLNLHTAHGLDVRIIRPFNVAGPRQSPNGGFVLPRFIQQAISNEPMTVFGDGTQLRAFTHVKDIVDGIVLAAERGQPGQAYNLGNPDNRLSINRLAELVKQVTNSNSPITHVDPTTIFGPLYAEAADKYPDATKAMTELGWQPCYDVIDTIRDAYQYTMQTQIAED